MQRLSRFILAAVALLVTAASAFGQGSLQQGGPWTPGHSPMYVGSGSGQAIVQDSGSAAGGPIGVGLAEQLLSVRSPTGTYPAVGQGTGPLGSNWCDYDAPTTNPTGYHYLCLSPNPGELIYGFAGGASAIPFTFNINGITFSLPTSGSGFVTAAIPTTNGSAVCFSGTTGLVVPCQIANSNLATVNAATLKGNPTASNAVAPTDFTIQGLTARGAPDANNDKILIYNNSTGTFQYVTPGLVASSGASGVSSLCSLTGALTATQNSACLNIFTSSLQGAVPASGGGTTNFLRADGTFAAVPPGGSSGQVQYNNSGAFGGLTNTQLTADINAFTSSLSGAVPASGGAAQNLLSADGTFKTAYGGVFDAVRQYGADPTGVANSATAIRNAVAAACPNSGPVGKVWLQAGTYLVNGGLNLTGLQQTCLIEGSGIQTTNLIITTTTNAVVDITGSAGVTLRNLEINSNATANAAYGLLLASTSGTGCDRLNFDHISITGKFTQAPLYIYGCSDARMDFVQIYGTNTSAPYVAFIGTANTLGATSVYATINTGTVATGDWTFNSVEIHDLSQVSGTSTVMPLAISINATSSPIRFFGGVIAGSPTGNAGYVTLVGSVNNASFIGEQFYSDNGSSAPFAFYNAGSTIQGLVFKSSNAIVTSGVFAVANSTVWADMDVVGNSPMGVPLFFPLSGNSGSLIRSVIDGQGQAINMGASGSVTHNVLLQPGTITASTQSNNGSF